MLKTKPIRAMAAAFMLCSCVASELALEKIDTSALNQPLHNAFVSEFRKIYIYTNGNVERIRNNTLSKDWLIASDEYLKLGGLSALRKKVLKIPGGGGKFSHSQTLHYKLSQHGSFYLNLEERFYKNKLNNNYCALYSKIDFLSTCEAAGKMMGRAPDRNQIYKKNDAHFISWNFKLSGRDVK
ncbi:MAG: hypothetical protein AB8B49_08965, partial [Nitratireductor sp.]